ncbi:2-dehydropantoate 2-reductase [Tetragenococcus halophilus subsp. halophilus]|uniref:2-dehydropantoate 2-reductase n=1 Tax=Tetragenococcus halophilus TaxID=51669 RepID=UPI00083DCB68|nr:2-dehydropantoate 2-reductase [Tetragenococcus halophilus]AOF48539.1 2-dehydropantoate 2-reductase [Tetragenococcus halophilus]NWN99686.1 2-dehydropantoate 2-reductase [Tetragenococcus halophilus]RQD32469.1 2-dehydropantoate 2-reductase [Tetragenococcus halophilus subsp. halophilus DSM 20339]WJS81223.1 2-dehydropantoate 2-reductase [Tetragenococcus halophilus]GBD58634.1 2-dehydropantoate 2-reductase [Tetragenococcus halophilus subsp. halophilus]
MKIIIAGAGAMGSRFGLMLHRANHEVVLVDGWQEHIDAINKNGLQANFNGEKIVENISAYNQNEIAKVDFSADLVILFTKAMQLDSMLQSINSLLHEDTKVLCLLNGIGHEDMIKKYVPYQNIFLGNTMWTSGLQGPGKVKLFGDGSIDLQNLAQGQEQAANTIVEALNRADLNAKYSSNILSSIYKKACVNGSVNGLCTVLECNIASLGASSYANIIISQIVDEFIAIANAQNIFLDKDEVLTQIKSSFDPETIGLHYPSMYQDLIDNKRLTEIDYINGVIVRKGKQYQIPTPYCNFLTELIHSKEEILGVS